MMRIRRSISVPVPSSYTSGQMVILTTRDAPGERTNRSSDVATFQSRSLELLDRRMVTLSPVALYSIANTKWTTSPVETFWEMRSGGWS